MSTPTPAPITSPAAGPSTAKGSPSDQPQLLRSSAIMAAGTVVSRITGFCRDTLVILAAIGTDMLGDAYRVSQTVPTALYVLLAGGVLNAVFIPQIVRAMKNHPDGGDSYVDRLLTLTGLVLIVLTVALTLSAPLLVPLWTNWSNQDALRVIVMLSYWSLPQIFFYGYITVLSQVLNARGLFGPMMWAPILSNLVVIASGLLFIHYVPTIDEHDPTSLPTLGFILLGGGSLLGVIVQTVVLIPPLYRSGYRYHPRFNFRGFGLRKTGHLAKWTLLFVLMNQLGFIIITRVGTSLTEQGQALFGRDFGYGFASYNAAYMIFILPHSIVTVSLVTALLPRMSSSAVEGKTDELRSQVSEGLRLSAILIIPAATAFLVLGPEIARALVSASLNTAGATYIGYILCAFGPGLLAFTANYLLLRGFYAQEDTKTPFFLNLIIVGVNVLGVLAAQQFLPVQWAAVGMAAAFSLAYTAGAFASYLVLRGRLQHLDTRRIVGTYVKLILACALAAGPSVLVSRVVQAQLGHSIVANLLTLAASGVTLLVLSLALGVVLRVPEITQLSGKIKAKLTPRPAA